MKVLLTSVLVLALAFATCLPASAGPTPEQAEKVAQGMVKMQDKLKGIQASIGTTLTSLNGLTTAQGSDLSKKYKEFQKNLTAMEKGAADAKKSAQDMNAKRDEYLKSWEASQATIQNEELKATSAARRAELMPKIETIKTSLGSASTAYTPFVQDLKDLNTYLASSLTPQGVAGASSLITKSNDAGNAVKADIDKGIAGLQDLASSLSPGAAAAPKK